MGLVETLSSAGPFTVFAPTNDAFAALPAGTLDSLLQPENKGTLADILTYHVVSGKVLSTDLASSQEVATVQGDVLVIKKKSGQACNFQCYLDRYPDLQKAFGATNTKDAERHYNNNGRREGRDCTCGDAVTVNGWNVVAADNEATNGVAHIIDGVLLASLLPKPAPKNLVELAQSVDILSTLVAAVVAGDLVETLSSAGPFTVFAPTNDAFAALPAGTLDSLLQPE